MNKYCVLTSLLISFLLLSMASTGNNSGKPPLLIQLTVRQKTTQLWVTMRLSNQSAKPIYLNKIDIGMTARLQNKVFTIKSGKQEIAYTGMLVKRRSPMTTDFVLLEPGESLQTRLRLDNSYAFKLGKHRYFIHYRQYHGSPNEPSFLQELTSQPYPFDFVLKGA